MARLTLLLVCLVAIACLATADMCSVPGRTCSTCTNSRASSSSTCVWCSASNECVSPTTTCSASWSSRVTSSWMCPSAPVAPACTAYSCGSCVAQASCGWCSSLGRCLVGSRYGPSAYSCPASTYQTAWQWSSCPSNNPVPVATREHKSMITILVLGGVMALIAGSVMIVVCVRRRRQLASNDATSFELGPTDNFAIEDDESSSSPSFISQPQFGNALPGYLYTTQSNDASQPQYVYTAVPVGPVVNSIPQ